MYMYYGIDSFLCNESVLVHMCRSTTWMIMKALHKRMHDVITLQEISKIVHTYIYFIRKHMIWASTRMKYNGIKVNLILCKSVSKWCILVVHVFHLCGIHFWNSSEKHVVIPWQQLIQNVKLPIILNNQLDTKSNRPMILIA